MTSRRSSVERIGSAYWLQKYGLETSGMGWRRQQTRRAREAGLRRITRNCAHHDMTTFILGGHAYHRCSRCRQDAVSRWRCRAKLRLIEVASGCCVAAATTSIPPLSTSITWSRPKSGTRLAAPATHANSRRPSRKRENALCSANCHAEVERGVTTIPDELVRGAPEGGANLRRRAA
jgi:hypothetical protein